MRVSFDTIETTAVVLLVVGAASIFAWILTSNRVPEAAAGLLLALSDRPWVILLMINVILLIVGCFMETVAAITIMVPVLLPVATAIGVDPVHFGVVICINLIMGLLTPPVGAGLFVSAAVSGLKPERIMLALWPFLLATVIVLLVLILEPRLTTILLQ